MAYVTNSRKPKIPRGERLGFAIIGISILISTGALFAIAIESALSNPEVQQSLLRFN